MKVLYLNSGNLFGGIETLLLTIARCRSLCPEMEPEFAVCFEGRFASALRECGVPVHLLGNARMSRPWQVWRARRVLKEVIAARSPDVVACHGSWSQALLGPAVKQSGVPLVYWTHDRVTDPLPWQERWASRCAPDLVIANSRYTITGQRALFTGVPAQVIYCPSDPPSRRFSPEECRQFREANQTPGDVPVILQVSRLDPHKGHLLHLAALAELRDKAWISWIVAAPQRPSEVLLLDTLRERAQDLGIADRIRFLGWQPDIGLPMEAADIFLQPNSGPEPFGLTFVEALYRKRPVVSTAMAGALEVVSEDCGILTPPGDVTALSDALRRLISDESLRRHLGEAGPSRARMLCDPQARLAEMERSFRGLRKT